MSKRVSGKLVLNDALTMTWNGFVDWPPNLGILYARLPVAEFYTEVCPIEGTVAEVDEVLEEVKAVLEAFPNLSCDGELLFTDQEGHTFEKIVVTPDRKAMVVKAVMHWPEELCTGK